MAIKILKDWKHVYSVQVNEDGTLTMYREYKTSKKWHHWERIEKKGPVTNVDAVIKFHGGIERVLAKLEEVDDILSIHKQLNKEKHEQRTRIEQGMTEAEQVHRERMLRKEEAWNENARREYEKVFSNEVTEANYENIRVLLHYLSTMNWGLWDLPQMTIGYSANQYDCGGRIAVAIKLDEKIELPLGGKSDKFSFGNGRGYLNNYTRIIL